MRTISTYRKSGRLFILRVIAWLRKPCPFRAHKPGSVQRQITPGLLVIREESLESPIIGCKGHLSVWLDRQPSIWTRINLEVLLILLQSVAPRLRELHKTPLRIRGPSPRSGGPGRLGPYVLCVRSTRRRMECKAERFGKGTASQAAEKLANPCSTVEERRFSFSAA